MNINQLQKIEFYFFPCTNCYQKNKEIEKEKKRPHNSRIPCIKKA